MKPEITNLLHRLAEPTHMGEFQGLVLFPSGAAIANYRHGCRPFTNLCDLEQFAYTPRPSEESGEGEASPTPTQ